MLIQICISTHKNISRDYKRHNKNDEMHDQVKNSKIPSMKNHKP